MTGRLLPPLIQQKKEFSAAQIKVLTAHRHIHPLVRYTLRNGLDKILGYCRISLSGAILYHLNVFAVYISCLPAPVVILQAKIEQLPIPRPADAVIIRYVRSQSRRLLTCLAENRPCAQY